MRSGQMYLNHAGGEVITRQHLAQERARMKRLVVRSRAAPLS